MPLKGPPPSFAWDQLTCSARLDFFTVFCPVKMPLPPLDGKSNWVRDPQDKTSFNLTVHDPTRADVMKVSETLENPILMRLELAVDFAPRKGVTLASREDLLQQTFHAVAGRFRPEDATYWGYGLRGAVTGAGQVPKPFHTRYPAPESQLLYGHRGDYMQSKVYLKRRDQHQPLPLERHCIRAEVSIMRGGLMADEFELERLLALRGYPYRRMFAKHFRFIDHPEVRARNERNQTDLARLERRMGQAWARAGVGKFAPDMNFPSDTLHLAAQRARSRALQQLPRGDYVLKRDVLANRKIATALRSLEC